MYGYLIDDQKYEENDYCLLRTRVVYHVVRKRVYNKTARRISRHIVGVQ